MSATTLSPLDRTDGRLGSLDAYRGFVMICLAANGFGMAATAKNFPAGSLSQFLKYQFDHVPWVGCAFWDLIQPSFMFMVGVALPYSYAKRQASGEALGAMCRHAAVRSLVLILLAFFGGGLLLGLLASLMTIFQLKREARKLNRALQNMTHEASATLPPVSGNANNV